MTAARRIAEPVRSGTIRKLVIALGILLLLVAAWFLVAGGSRERAVPALTVAEIESLTPDLAGDVRLLRELRQRLTGRLDGSDLPEGLRPLYLTLCIEEMARTDGWGPRLFAVPEAADVVRPQAAAAAYEALGQPEAAAIMGNLDRMLTAEGPGWRERAERARNGELVPDDANRAALARLSAQLDRLLPRIRAARLAWFRRTLAAGRSPDCHAVAVSTGTCPGMFHSASGT